MMKLPRDIIIVEDEVMTQRYLKNILKEYDVEVQACFDNAKDILNNLKKLHCTMILMDINIKGSMDGLLLAEEILYRCDIPIIFMTAHNDEDTLEEISSLKHYGVIIKPFSSKEMISVLENALLIREKESVKEIKEEDNFVITPSLVYIKSEKILYHHDKKVTLNSNQAKLLILLLKYKNEVVKYSFLTYEIWGDEEISDSSLRTLVYSLRKLDIGLPILSHSKAGYSLKIKE